MQEYYYDVIVCGGGPAGIAAALAASSAGARTLLLESNPYVGGCAASGLPFIDFYSGRYEQIIRGSAQELIGRLVQENACLGHIKTSQGHIHSITMLDPEWVKICAEQMLLEAKCSILYRSFVAGAITEGNRVKGVLVANKAGISRYLAGCVIDCTGDGDVAAFSGAAFEKGRPSDGFMQAMSLLFRLVNVDVESFGKNFHENPIIAQPFGADHVYNVHLSGTLEPWDELILKEGVFDHPRHNFWAGTCRDHELTYVNTVRVTGLDPTDPVQLSEAEMEGRRQMTRLLKFFNKHVPGLEHAYAASVQNGIGIRESRRIVGEYTLTGEDVLEGRHFADGVCKNGYCIDIHDPKGKGWNARQITSPEKCYDIPYRCLVPAQTDGLLVAGRCISATHEALGSVRIMAPCMGTGQAAGTAAAMAVSEKKDVRDIDTAALRAALQKADVLL